MHIDNGFDLNAYKPMKKSCYDFNKLICLAHDVKDKPNGTSETQKKDTGASGIMAVPKVGLGYVPGQPI